MNTKCLTFQPEAGFSHQTSIAGGKRAREDSEVSACQGHGTHNHPERPIIEQRVHLDATVIRLTDRRPTRHDPPARRAQQRGREHASGGIQLPSETSRKCGQCPLPVAVTVSVRDSSRVLTSNVKLLSLCGCVEGGQGTSGLSPAFLARTERRTKRADNDGMSPKRLRCTRVCFPPASTHPHRPISTRHRDAQGHGEPLHTGHSNLVMQCMEPEHHETDSFSSETEVVGNT
jgi:hypothetical protein